MPPPPLPPLLPLRFAARLPSTSVIYARLLLQLLVAVAAACSWGQLSWGDRRLVAAWTTTALVLPAWRRFAPSLHPRSRATIETAMQLCNTATPTALSMSLVSAGTMARLQRMENAALFLAGAAASKGGLWGALHVSMSGGTIVLAGCLLVAGPALACMQFHRCFTALT